MNLEIPCYVRNRQGECLWLHDGKVIGNIQDKYSFQRTPINGEFFQVFWLILYHYYYFLF